MVLTASSVQSPRDLVEEAEFRSTLARGNQDALWPEPGDEPDPGAALYVILLHSKSRFPRGEQAAHGYLPGSAYLAFPPGRLLPSAGPACNRGEPGILPFHERCHQRREESRPAPAQVAARHRCVRLGLRRAARSVFPGPCAARRPILLSDSEIEQAAEDVRRYWRMGDGPIANMILLLENQGAIVGRDRLGADTLDGLSRVDTRPHMVIGIDKGSPARWRFDAAHELGHIVLHAKMRRESLDRPEVHRKVEQQAHRFARAFLLPLGPFGDDLFGVSLDAFRAIKPKWNVSIATMIFRARDARLMSEETERKLRIGISRRRWRIVEPYDETTEAEEPRVLRRSFELILNARDQTPADITGRIGLPASDIETLSGLPGGYLADFARVTLLPSREPKDSGTSDGTARVIDLTARQRSAR